MSELESALIKIHDENRYYNIELVEKYFSNSATDLYLNAEELAWLEEHGHIRVGYQDNYLAFCAEDKATGELTGALTAVRNKGAYDISTRKLQHRIEDPDDRPEFAVAIFDCDDLKLINDRYGHDKGDLYLKNASAMICRVFQHSAVYRIGGDEFAVILKNEDYLNRESLLKLFKSKCEATCVNTNEWWDQVRVSVGMTDFDPSDDHTVEEVAHRADKLMYEDKHERKTGRKD